MLNLTPDTLLQWSGGCWIAMPSAPQGAQSKVNSSQPAAAPAGHAGQAVGQMREQQNHDDHTAGAVHPSAKAA